MRETIKATIKKIPSLRYTYRRVSAAYAGYRAHRRAPQDVFTDIFKQNFWGGARSVSGPGSEIDQTRNILAALPPLLASVGASVILDVPCGDYHWMNRLQLGETKYVGADIVCDLIERNRQYETDQVRFVHANLMTDDLPTADLVLCRDCLVHFSFADIHRALKNLCRSNSEYLLTTTFPDHPDNIDIETGSWRTLNLERAPFNFPAPLRVIVEGCTENDGAYTDKSLGLWRLRDIEQCLQRRPG